MMQVPAPLQTTIHEGIGAQQRLALLGLTVDDLAEVVRRGEYARAGATAHDPITAEGYDAYRHRVRATRDILVPRGWAKSVDQNLEATRSPCGRWSIITRGGDEGVGIRDAHPQPRRAIGETIAKVSKVNATLMLDPNWFNAAAAPAATSTPEAATKTWMLLVHRDGDSVRSELSLPVEGSAEDVALSSLERILLPALDLSPVPADEPVVPNEPVEIDVPVIRKR